MLERRRPNPNFLRIGTTAAPTKASAEVGYVSLSRKGLPETCNKRVIWKALAQNRSSQIHHPTSIEKQEEVEEKDTEKEKQAGQLPEVDFKKDKGAKTGED